MQKMGVRQWTMAYPAVAVPDMIVWNQRNKACIKEETMFNNSLSGERNERVNPAQAVAADIIDHPDRANGKQLAIVASDLWASVAVLKHTNRSDPQLIATVAGDPRASAEVLIARRDICDPQLIAAVANDLRVAAHVLKVTDRSDPQLIAVVAGNPEVAGEVLKVTRRYDPELIAAVAGVPALARHVCTFRPDLRAYLK